MSAPEPLTELIRRAGDGDRAALAQLFAATYEDLRRMAHNRLRPAERGTMLDTTSLVHESFMRLAQSGQLRVDDRLHFFRYAGRVMRSVVVDLARARASERRGGDQRPVPLDTSLLDRIADVGPVEILRIHEALEELAQVSPRLVQVVELRYFAGLGEAEIGEALGVAARTVRRDWEKARLLLAQALA